MTDVTPPALPRVTDRTLSSMQTAGQLPLILQPTCFVVDQRESQSDGFLKRFAFIGTHFG